jgi:hypothetical protein
VRETLLAGHAVAVVGWDNHHNHNDFTRDLPRKRILFHNSTPPSLGGDVQFVLFTPHMDHSVTARIKKEKPVAPFVLRVRQIKDILASCTDILVTAKPAHVPHADHVALDQQSVAPESPDLGDDVLDFLTTPPPRRNEMDLSHPDQHMVAFVDAFLAHVKTTSDGRVSKAILGKLLRIYGVKEDTTQLRKHEWLIGETSAGSTHVGWYKPGPKMTGMPMPEKITEPPQDPYQNALWWIEQKPAILAKVEDVKAQMQVELDKLNAQLTHIEHAEQVVGKLKKLQQQPTV